MKKYVLITDSLSFPIINVYTSIEYKSAAGTQQIYTILQSI